MNEVDKHQVTPSVPFAGKWSSMPVKILVWAARVLLGGTFIFSGFVKAVDPWGTVFKLQEYFDALHLVQISAAVVPITFFLFCVEFLIGISVLLGCYRRLSVWASACFMAVMLPMTLWIAVKNPVADCGCFGDALPLSNWATFGKNVILTIMVVWLLLANRKARCLITPALQWISFSVTIVFIILIGWVGYYYQPLIDFRPFPVGTMMSDLVKEDEDADVEDMVGVYEKDGVQVRLPLDSIPDESWVFVKREEKESTKSEGGNHLAIYDVDDDSDVTAELLSGNGDQILVFYSPLADVSTASFYRVNSLYNYSLSHNIQMAAIAYGSPEQIDEFRDLSLAEFPIYLADDSLIKEIVRGNPGVVMLRNGEIIWKSSLAAMSPDDFMSSKSPKDATLFARNDKSILFTLIWIYSCIMAILIIASFIPGVIRSLNGRARNRFIKDASAVIMGALLTMSISSCSSSDEPDPSDNHIESATLIYMVANNSLAQFSNTDITEILEGCENIDLKSNRISIFIASPYYDQGLYEVSKDKIGKASLKLVKSYNDGVSAVNSSRISEVIEYFRETYPTQSYGLFLWSHATGWIPADKSPDGIIKKSFGDDHGYKINITQLAGALPDGMMNYIWCDCCLMGGIETCYALRNKTRHVICSPTEVASEGAPYQLILPFLMGKDPDIVSAARTEFDYYNNKGGYSLGFSVAVIDCEALQNVTEESRKIVAPSYPYISTASLQTYGTQSVLLSSGKRVGVTFYDFAETFRRYAEIRKCDFEPFQKALNDAVIYKAATPYFGTIRIDPKYFSGLSVYVPLPPDAVGYNAEVESFYYKLAWSEAILR